VRATPLTSYGPHKNLGFVFQRIPGITYVVLVDVLLVDVVLVDVVLVVVLVVVVALVVVLVVVVVFLEVVLVGGISQMVPLGSLTH
jgi:hypothetical protein